VPALEEMSRDELIALVRRQDGQITVMAGQIADLMEVNEAPTGRLARAEHLLSRNSGNSSFTSVQGRRSYRLPTMAAGLGWADRDVVGARPSGGKVGAGASDQSSEETPRR
jgi:hypothetical protein